MTTIKTTGTELCEAVGADIEAQAFGSDAEVELTEREDGRFAVAINGVDAGTDWIVDAETAAYLAE